MIRPHRILELGTFTGYSALCLAEGLTEGGEVHTIEIDDEIEDFTRSYFDKSPLRDLDKIDYRRCFGHHSDTNRHVRHRVYRCQQKGLLEILRARIAEGATGRVILADNTLWDGKVVTDPNSRDAQTIGIERFNDFVATDNRVEKIILPLRDGLTILWKKP